MVASNRSRRTSWIVVGFAVFAIATVGYLWYGVLRTSPAGPAAPLRVPPAAVAAAVAGASDHFDLIMPMVVFGRRPAARGAVAVPLVASALPAAGAQSAPASTGPRTGGIGIVESPAPLTPAHPGVPRHRVLRTVRAHPAAPPPPAPRSGALPSGAIRQALGAKDAAVERCYKDATTQDPSLAGDATFLVTVKPAGSVRVRVGEASPQLAADGVTDCIKSRLESLDFSRDPPRGGDVNLRLPMSFEQP